VNAGVTRVDIARAFERSPEYATNTVDHLYATLLNRAPDQGGLDYFVALLEQGASAAQIEQIFLGSPEYYQRAGATSTGLLKAFYRDILG
jgi:Domain of unknown function (DUF4214)